MSPPARPAHAHRYRGSFLDGARHGEGALLYSTGARYEGGWAADRKHGEGAVYVFEDGSVFEGPFANDRPDLARGAFSHGSGSAGVAECGGSGGGGAVAQTVSVLTKGKLPSAGKAAPAATPAKARASSSGAAVTSGSAAAAAAAPAPAPAPGFGARVSGLQLYIDDLLADEESPAAAARAVGNLLQGFNGELRRLYDRYWCGAPAGCLTRARARRGWRACAWLPSIAL